MEGVLTLGLALMSILAGLVAFKQCKGFGGGRVLVSGLTVLSVWGASVYLFWLAGVELKVGTIQDDNMRQHWWLPLATILMLLASYKVFKPPKNSYPDNEMARQAISPAKYREVTLKDIDANDLTASTLAAEELMIDSDQECIEHGNVAAKASNLPPSGFTHTSEASFKVRSRKPGEK